MTRILTLNTTAVEAMREKGIDISAEIPKGFDALPEGTFDFVVRDQIEEKVRGLLSGRP